MLTPLEEAESFVFESIVRQPYVGVAIRDACGLVLADDVISALDVPPFDNSSVDGFALLHGDTVTATDATPTRLRILGSVAAGSASPADLEAGTAYRIMTGAPLPTQADCVVMVEDTKSPSEHEVLLSQSVPAGSNIRRRGSDVSAGSVVLSAGSQISPAAIGSFASVGVQSVTVFRRPRIGVISTGDELSDAPDPVKGQIHDSNRPSLLAALARAGAIPVDLGITRDSPELLYDAFKQGADDCDALVTTGGVSVGDYDFSKKVLQELSGAQMRWMQVAIKPAKPFAFGLIGQTPVFGLPGNPVSALVSFELFVAPAIRKMMGHSNFSNTTMVGRAGETYRRRKDGKTHFIRSWVEFTSDGPVLRSSGGQVSHMLRSMAQADALVVLEDGEGTALGERIDFLMLGF